MKLHTFLYFNIVELSSFKDNNLTLKQAQKAPIGNFERKCIRRKYTIVQNSIVQKHFVNESITKSTKIISESYYSELITKMNIIII